jgi:hypothetical protein
MVAKLLKLLAGGPGFVVPFAVAPESLGFRTNCPVNVGRRGGGVKRA